MSDYKITVTDATTGETIEREMDEAEKSMRDAFLAAVAAEDATAKAIADKAATDKAALLDKLGISADEAKLLLS